MNKYYYKLITFIKALFWHIHAGMPKSSQQEIDNRYEICSNCEFMDHKNSQCLVCGCNLSRKKIFMNKLAWKDQKCPKNKW